MRKSYARWETADDYSRVVFQDGLIRVVECQDGIQWLLQRRRPGKTGGGTAWDTIGYCVSRKAIVRLTRPHSPSGADFLEANLPRVFPREKTETTNPNSAKTNKHSRKWLTGATAHG